MKKILLTLWVVILSLSIFSGCSVSIDKDFLNSSVSFDASSNITASSGIANNVLTDEHDISDEALELAEETVEEDGVYTTPATVAAYIHIFNKLPSNYITKKEAQKLGWEASKGNLNKVAPGKSIGGDTFSNRENILPKGTYKECDVNYKKGKRNSERIVYDKKGNIYYTDDHYNSFEQLYEED